MHKRARGTHRAIDVVVVPHLIQDSAVVSAAQERNCAGLLLQCELQLAEAIGGFVGRDDADASIVAVSGCARRRPSIAYDASMSNVG